MPKHKNTLPIVALVVANILWGINIPLVKLGLRSIPLVVFMTVKFVLAALIFLPFAVKTWRPLKKKEMGLMCISSLLYMACSTLAVNVGLKYAPSINFAVISLTGPLLLCVLSVQFLKEKMGLKTIAGVAIAFAGAAVIVGRPWEVDLSDPTVLLGNVFFLVAVLSGVVSTLIAKPILGKISSYQATFLLLFVGILPLVPFAIMQAVKDGGVHGVTTGGYVALIYGITGVSLANFLYFYGLKYKNAYSVGIFDYIEKVVIIIAAWFILAERPSLKFALGAALTFIGVYLAEAKLPQRLAAIRLKRG